ncbi:glycosyltransferase family 4 protein [uncultured Olleya sp.]|uniref:glycosyltransferase family 4 protein n=1 Tax=uncultured Olleya sp. TaxID=757243 RepID=UPI0025929156|nr:glycosyltransferase family 4 protein [uncultured Olleya sp.]
MRPKPDYIYVAFDVFPSQKGAATHINHCLKALQRTFDVGLLICLGTEEMPSFQFDQERQLYVYRWKDKVVNFLERTTRFQEAITDIIQRPLCDSVKLVHFRDIWGGLPLLQLQASYKTVFEVNAFQHIELPNRYPNISSAVLDKIKSIERFCIVNSDTIITPSNVTHQFITHYVDTEDLNIIVVPNGVSIYKPKTIQDQTVHSTPFILYFGALQKWQGIKTLFKAFNELLDLELRLRICTSVPEKRTLHYKTLANTLGIAHRIDWFYEQDKPTLAAHIQQAKLTVAPLVACDRNIIQGCHPLKIVESMAYGTPVVASDLPVVTEIVTANKTGVLVPPDRPEILGRTIRKLLESPSLLEAIGKGALLDIKNNYLWEAQELKMTTVYKNLLSNV